MKVFKRNAVIITVLLFVCVAVYLNWSYNRGKDLSVNNDTAETTDNSGTDSNDTKDSGDSADESSLYYEGDDSSVASSGSFDAMRLSRKEARDSATSTLQEAAAVEGISQEELDSVVSSIAVMANYSVSEAKIENNLLAKEFEDCVVFISEGAVNVYVPAPEEGLSDVAVAKIADSVIAEIDVTAEQIRITEIK